jgi:hypothetical protein
MQAAMLGEQVVGLEAYTVNSCAVKPKRELLKTLAIT